MVRPMPESKYTLFENWLKEQIWECVISVETVHEKAAVLQSTLLAAMNKIFPEKEVSFTGDDQPWINSKIKTEIRKRKRIYAAQRKSPMWNKQNTIVKILVKSAKRNFYKKQIEDCKTARSSQWYSKLKRMTKHDPHES